jgi:hypothetical protein
VPPLDAALGLRVQPQILVAAVADGITSRPPIRSCSSNAGGTCSGAAVTRIASNGAASGQPA